MKLHINIKFLSYWIINLGLLVVGFFLLWCAFNSTELGDGWSALLELFAIICLIITHYILKHEYKK